MSRQILTGSKPPTLSNFIPNSPNSKNYGTKLQPPKLEPPPVLTKGATVKIAPPTLIMAPSLHKSAPSGANIVVPTVGQITLIPKLGGVISEPIPDETIVTIPKQKTPPIIPTPTSTPSIPVLSGTPSMIPSIPIVKSSTPPKIISLDTSTVPTIPKVKPGLVSLDDTPSKPKIISLDNEPKKGLPLKIVDLDAPTIRIGALNANDYQHLSQREHIYKIPDTYVGSVARTERSDYAYVQGFNLPQLEGHPEITTPMAYIVMEIPEAMERVFLEILSNAADNITRSHMANVDPGVIDVRMTTKTVTIKNEGLPIPVEMHATETDESTGRPLWVPEMIFGVLLTSSHYDTKFIRVENGRNGYGAKLTNIFSKEFRVLIYDHIHHKRYYQVWSNNMQAKSLPDISDYNGTTSSVEISWDLDFERFGYTEYPAEAFALFARHTADVSVTSKVPCRFNGMDFDFRDIHDYTNLYFEKKTSRVVHRQWAPEIETKEYRGELFAVDPKNIPDVELCILDTPDNGKIISFVNGILTINGGVHVQAAFKAISGPILDAIQDSGTSKKKGKGSEEKRGKGKGTKGTRRGRGNPKTEEVKEVKKEEDKKIKLTLLDIKPHISMILICHLYNPTFKSQMKNELATPTPKITIPDMTFRPVFKWDLVDRLYASLQAKQFKTMLKNDSSRRKHLRLEKGEDANFAGDPNYGRYCTGVVCEGDSAMLYPEVLKNLLENGVDYFGFIPLKGKPPNAMNMSMFRSAGNAVFNRIKDFMGLSEGIDYRVDENYYGLRYGFLMIMADADVDGKHIIGLILNWIYVHFPTLFSRRCILIYRTPVIRVTLGSDLYRFYSDGQYNEWRTKNPALASRVTPDNIKYFKGLGTSTKKEIKDDAANRHVVECIYDDKAPEAFKLAFDKKMADQRKIWLSTWKRSYDIESVKYLPISEFFINEFVEYGLANVVRSIPSIDGFKESQRKIWYGVYQKWKSGKETNLLLVRNPKPVKVPTLSNITAEKTNYHHGPSIIDGTISKMAQNFVGSNNMPYFTREGQFGTRKMGPSVYASGRYVSVAPEAWFSYVYRKEDLPLLEFLSDEGEFIEPKITLPIIPMLLINGTLGIATAHSTFIPNFHPLQMVQWLREKIKGHYLPSIFPWYRGFKGQISIEKGSTSKSGRVKKRMMTQGTFEMMADGRIHITELPIGLWTDNYRAWLDYMKEQGKLRHYTRGNVNQVKAKKKKTENDDESENTISYFLQGFLEGANHHSLGLKKSLPMSNMVVNDLNGAPRRFETVDEILEYFYQWRLPYYEKRRENMLKEIKEKIVKADDKLRFIIAVENGDIVLVRGDDSIAKAKMDELKLPHTLLKGVRAGNFLRNEKAVLTKKIAELNEKYKQISETTGSNLWLSDLDDFVKVYLEMFPEDRDQMVAEAISSDLNMMDIKISTSTTESGPAIITLPTLAKEEKKLFGPAPRLGEPVNITLPKDLAFPGYEHLENEAKVKKLLVYKKIDEEKSDIEIVRPRLNNVLFS